jgi:hypothetical protein
VFAPEGSGVINPKWALSPHLLLCSFPASTCQPVALCFPSSQVISHDPITWLAHVACPSQQETTQVKDSHTRIKPLALASGHGRRCSRARATFQAHRRSFPKSPQNGPVIATRPIVLSIGAESPGHHNWAHAARPDEKGYLLRVVHNALYSFSHVHIMHTRSALYSFSFPALYLLKQDSDITLDSSHFHGLERYELL